MAQTTDYEIANSSGLVFRGRVNEVFAAVQSNNSGSTAPTDTVGGMLWLDTSVSPAVLRRRNSADSAWLVTFSEEDYASQAEAEAGSNNTKLMTPLSVSQAIDAQNINLSSLVTLSGSSVDFTGIPSTARRVTVNFNGLSTNGTTVPLIQLGDSGGIETSGYVGAVGIVAPSPALSNFSTGVLFSTSWTASSVLQGSIVFSLMDSATNLWAIIGIAGRSDGAFVHTLGGSKALSATLTQLRLTAGANSFDAGTASISWE